MNQTKGIATRSNFYKDSEVVLIKNITDKIRKQNLNFRIMLGRR